MMFYIRCCTKTLHLTIRHRRTSTASVCKIKNCLIYGDSNTWGFDPKSAGSSFPMRIPRSLRWTTLLQDKLGSSSAVVVEALNARTTTFTDPSSPCDGEYDCNGRNMFTTILHSHKPLSLVVIALGTNDMKDKFNTSPHDIVSGIRCLVRDVRKASSIADKPDEIPKILVLGPPIIYTTPVSKIWGFVDGSTEKSKKVSSLLMSVSKDINVAYLSLASVATVSNTDGVHFDETTQELIANAVYEKIVEIAIS